MPDLKELQSEYRQRRPSLIVLQSEDSDHPDLNAIQAVADRMYSSRREKQDNEDDDDDEEEENEEERDRGRPLLKVRSLQGRFSPPRVVSPQYMDRLSERRSSSISRLPALLTKKLKIKSRRQSIF